MAPVTLLGTHLGKKDQVFVYLGPLNDCKNCKLKSVCFNLKPGRSYVVTNVREKHHDCSVHEGDVVVVEVDELPLEAAIDRTLSKGDSTTIKTLRCQHIGCPHYELCTNPGLTEGKTYRIVSTDESIDCFQEMQLKKAQITESS